MGKQSEKDIDQLSRRERQIMDLIFRLKEASAREVLERIDNPPSYSAIRASIRILEEKGLLSHVEKDGRYVFSPTVQPDRARRSAIHRVIATFFDNSASKALSALLSSDELTIDEEELDRLENLIAEARKRKGEK